MREIIGNSSIHLLQGDEGKTIPNALQCMAVEAATAIGCTVGQIAKSLLFRTVKGKKPILVIASGINQVDEAQIADFVGEPIEKADAAYVQE